MKILLNLIIIFVILTSCKTNKFLLTDYSNSAFEPTQLIISNLNNYTNSFEVEITNSHGGIYVVKSNIELNIDSIKITSRINNNSYGTESDTIMTFTKKEFMEKLNFELLNAEKQIKIAGNYQTIKIINKDLISIFQTRQAFGLMRLLEEGKSNIVTNKN